MINNNSPLSLRVKDVTTMGRHCTDLLKWIKHKDYKYYEKTHCNDKVAKIS